MESCNRTTIKITDGNDELRTYTFDYTGLEATARYTIPSHINNIASCMQEKYDRFPQ